MRKDFLFIIPSLAGGGTEKVLVDILQNRNFSKYKVSLFLEFAEGIYLSDIPSNVEILSLYKEHTIWHDRWFRLLRMLHIYIYYHSFVYKSFMRYLLKKRKFDAIISFMEGNALKVHSYVCDKSSNNISWVHLDLKKKHWSLDFFQNSRNELKAYQRMDRIVCVSEDVRKAFNILYPTIARRCIVIYNLIDREKIIKTANERRISKTKFTICMVGRLNQQKRYDRALAVAKRLHEDGYDFELWILGEGSLETALKETAKAYGIDGRVRLLGFQKPSYSYMKEADLFLNTSEAEGYPLVICEALCLGLAIVATNISGASEILAGSEYGLLTGEGVEDIYRSMKRMMDDDTLRNYYREKARQRAAMFDVPATMEQIYKIL